jgi:hypothetical protein
LADGRRLAELIFKTLWLASNAFCFVSARNERSLIKSKIQPPFSAERRRAQAQNGIDGAARMDDLVYAGFELELAGTERPLIPVL